MFDQNYRYKRLNYINITTTFLIFVRIIFRERDLSEVSIPDISSLIQIEN